MVIRSVSCGLAVALTCAAGAIIAAPQTASLPRATGQPAVATGVIAGVVLEADRNVPVEGAVVTLSGPDGRERRAMVDSRGRFVFTALPAGRYGLQADQFGYLRGEYGRLVWSGRRVPLELAEAQRVTDTSILMWRLASISGRVTDDAGEPVVGVTVRPLRRSVNSGEAQLFPAFDGFQAGLVTDDRGMFRAAQMPPGDYAIAVPARTSTFPVDVMRDALSSGIDLGVSETSLLVNFRNLQVGDQVLATMSSAPIPPAPVDGRVRVFQTTFYPGTIEVSEAQVMTLAPGDERSGVDIRLVASTTHRVSGQVMGPEGPLASRPFRVFRAPSSSVTDAADFEVATGVTNAEGKFTLLGIPRGEFVLRAPNARIPTTGSRSDAAPTLWSNERFTVGDADVTNLVVTARRAPRITGRVDMSTTPARRPEDVQLIVEPYDPGPPRVVNPRLGPDFTFSTEVLPGRYLVLAYSGFEMPCVSTANGRDVSDRLIDVQSQDIAVSVVCSGTPTRLSGVVRDENGRPDPRARVVVFSADRTHWSGAEYRPLRNRSADTSVAGAFSFPSLHAGEYFVVAIPDALADRWALPKVKESLMAAATRVTLTAGESRTVDLRTVTIR